MLTDSTLPNYPGISRKARSGNNDRAYYNINQFGTIRINQVSDVNGIIPPAAFSTQINVPPPGEIKISGGARINAFDNTFITFDTTTETFDESVVQTLMSDTNIKFDSSSVTFDGSGSALIPRDDAGLYNVDFSDTNVSFDSGINKFDNSFDLPVFERFDSTSFSLDNTNKTFDIG